MKMNRLAFALGEAMLSAEFLVVYGRLPANVLDHWHDTFNK